MLVFLLFTGKAEVHISNLEQPPEAMLYRKVDKEFVKQLTSSTQLEIGFNSVVFPVVPADEDTFSLSNIQSMRYWTLGGNHLRTALHEKLQKGLLSKEKQKVQIIIYR